MGVNIKRIRKIEVSLETYDRLQRRAVPFEDSPDSVIVRLLDESSTEGNGRPAGEPAVNETDGGGDAASGSGPALSVQGFGAEAEIDVAVDDAFNPPSLKHTKMLRAEVDGGEVRKANWTSVRQAVVAMALDRGGYNLRRLLEVCPMNAVETRKNNEGYTYYEDLGVSIQGQDANHAWQATAAVARALGVGVMVWFQWRTKPDAAHPGKWGLLTIG